MKSIRIRAGLLIVQDDRILLVRHEKHGRSYWLLPGGGVDYGETLQDAARRELLEETGLVAEVGDLALVWETLPPDASRHVLNLCFAARVSGTLACTRDERLQEASWLALADLGGLTMHPPLAEPIERWLRERCPLYLGPLWTE
jgi:8-oxo-dGTP diphosphatase